MRAIEPRPPVERAEVAGRIEPQRRGAVVEVDAHFESEPRPVAASFAAWLAERAARYAPRADPVAALVAKLVADRSLELARGAEVGSVAAVVEEALGRVLDGQARGRRVYEALLDCPLVDELFLDEEALAIVLAAADL
ncbi:MAG: hypothetical protein K8M05_22180 [Deltaproteobacteria bacterium]|nr:hypothetical protein [Kofleriaceae bacterium]